MNFLADENVSRHVVDRLRAEGHDVTLASDALAGSPDAAVLSAAEAAGRILISEDRDFGELVIRQRLPVRGIVLLELDRLSNHGEASRVLDVVRQHGATLDGHLVVIEPSRIRIRPLPPVSAP